MLQKHNTKKRHRCAIMISNKRRRAMRNMLLTNLLSPTEALQHLKALIKSMEHRKIFCSSMSIGLLLALRFWCAPSPVYIVRYVYEVFGRLVRSIVKGLKSLLGEEGS